MSDRIGACPRCGNNLIVGHRCPPGHGPSELAGPAGSDAALYKEATEAAEAWCRITDEEGRNHAIYCYRAGYIKAKRQNAPHEPRRE